MENVVKDMKQIKRRIRYLQASLVQLSFKHDHQRPALYKSLLNSLQNARVELKTGSNNELH